MQNEKNINPNIGNDVSGAGTGVTRVRPPIGTPLRAIRQRTGDGAFEIEEQSTQVMAEEGEVMHRTPSNSTTEGSVAVGCEINRQE